MKKISRVLLSLVAMVAMMPITAAAQTSVTCQIIPVVFDEPIEIEEAPNAVDFPGQLRSGIELRHVTFAYGEDEPAEWMELTDIQGAPLPPGAPPCY